MACGACLKNKGITKSVTRGVSSSNTRVSSEKPKVKVNPDSCMRMYESLRMLNSKSSKAYSVSRLDGSGGHEVSVSLLRCNKKIAIWINELGNKCPDPEELSECETVIEMAYEKYVK